MASFVDRCSVMVIERLDGQSVYVRPTANSRPRSRVGSRAGPALRCSMPWPLARATRHRGHDRSDEIRVRSPGSDSSEGPAFRRFSSEQVGPWPSRASSPSRATATPNTYDPGDPETYKQFIQALITDSRDYENSVLAPKRDEAQKYYYGYVAVAEPRRLALQRHPDRRGPATPPTRRSSAPTEGPTKSSIRLDRRARRHPDDAAEPGPHLRREPRTSSPRPAHAPGRRRLAEQATNLRQLCLLAGQRGLLDPVRRVQGRADGQDRLRQMVDRQHQGDEAQEFVNITMEQLQMLLVRGPDRARSCRARCNRTKPAASTSPSRRPRTSRSPASRACRRKRCASTATPAPSPSRASSATSGSSRSTN